MSLRSRYAARSLWSRSAAPGMRTSNTVKVLCSVLRYDSSIGASNSILSPRIFGPSVRGGSFYCFESG